MRSTGGALVRDNERLQRDRSLRTVAADIDLSVCQCDTAPPPEEVKWKNVQRGAWHPAARAVLRTVMVLVVAAAGAAIGFVASVLRLAAIQPCVAYDMGVPATGTSLMLCAVLSTLIVVIAHQVGLSVVGSLPRLERPSFVSSCVSARAAYSLSYQFALVLGFLVPCAFLSNVRSFNVTSAISSNTQPPSFSRPSCSFRTGF